MQQCSRCKVIKTSSEFYASQKGKVCKTCKKAAMACWYQKNKEAVIAKTTADQWFSRYGLTPDAYAAKIKAQANLCMICNKPPKPGKVLYIDHNHLTNQARDLLCQHCNSMLGFANDSPELLLAAIKYLGKHDKPTAQTGP